MNCIQTLVSEHDNILRMLEVVRKASLRGMRERDVDVQDFKQIVAFIRLYADNTHHGKEEKYLFQAMTDSLGRMADNLIRHGMLVEHDLARLYVSQLDAALDAQLEKATDENLLDILVAVGSYRELLMRHIAKENDVVFPYGEQNLPAELVAQVETEMSRFEEDSDNANIRNEQLQILENLEKKYS